MKALQAVAAVAIGLAGIAIGVLDATGIVGDGWFSQHIALLTLLVVSSMATFVGLTYEPRLAKLERSLQQSTDSVLMAIGRPETIVFDSAIAHWEHLSKRLAEATTVSDLTWGSGPARHVSAADRRAYEGYRKAIADKCRSTNIRYREVFTFPAAMRFKRMFDLIDQPDIDTYSARYYNVIPESIPPLLQFTIFDGSEIVTGPHRGDALDITGEIYLGIKDPSVVNLLSDYFESIWLKAIPIAEGSHKHQRTIDGLRADFKRLLEQEERGA
jgi:hypothetical protein